MSSTDLRSNAGLGSTIRSAPISSPQAMISFLCPRCNERLNVSGELAGITGPCPACSEVIRAPRRQAHSMVSRQMTVTSSLITLPALDQGRAEGRRLQGDPFQDKATMSPGDGSSFSAVKKIDAPAPDGLDDSWREKVERDRKQSRRRFRRDRWLDTALTSRRAEQYRKAGILTLTGILAITIGALYVNHRSGGAFFKALFG